MTVRCPKQIRVGAHTIPIFFVSDLGLVEEATGRFWDGTQGKGVKITIDKQCTGSALATVFLHELNHAVLWAYVPWELHHNSRLPNAEEVFVDGLAQGYAQVLRDNPKLFEWLQFILSGEAK